MKNLYHLKKNFEEYNCLISINDFYTLINKFLSC